MTMPADTLLDLPHLDFGALPLAVRRALAIREHLLSLVDDRCVVVGLTESLTPTAEQTVVVAVDLDPQLDCHIVMFAGTCDHAWWRAYCALVPLTWERMTPEQRAYEVRIYTTAADRAAMSDQVRRLQAALADVDQTQN